MLELERLNRQVGLLTDRQCRRAPTGTRFPRREPQNSGYPLALQGVDSRLEGSDTNHREPDECVEPSLLHACRVAVVSVSAFPLLTGCCSSHAEQNRTFNYW